MGKFRTYAQKSIKSSCSSVPDQQKVKVNPPNEEKDLQSRAKTNWTQNVVSFRCTQRPSNHAFNGHQKIRTKRYLILSFYAVTLFLSAFYHAQAAPTWTTTGNKALGLDLSLDPTTLEPLLLQEEESESIRNCTRPSSDDFPADLFTRESRRNGALVVHFIVSIYLFYALLIVCDEYFVPSVESICRDFQISSDIAGATFMAVSTSAPEFFTNVIGTFVTKGDLGVGTIVGSAVFNILAVGAVCGLGAGYAVQKLVDSADDSGDKIGLRLDWWPLTRDSFFYLISVFTLILVLFNRRVYWTEALFMLSIYAMYILVLCFNTKIKTFVESILEKICLYFSIQNSFQSGQKLPQRISVVVSKIVNINERTPLLLQVTEKGNLSPGGNAENGKIKIRKSCELDLVLSREYDIPAESLDQVLIYNALSRSNSFCQQEGDDCARLCTLPKDIELTVWIEWIVSWPIKWVFTFTIPDCRRYLWRKWYPLTLVMCVVWLGALTYVISWMISIIGETLSIPDSVTGLTFLAAGTSIPEVLSSLIVARQGLGSMGFSNTIGSNTFDVLVCLGLPWLIQSAIYAAGNGVEVDYIEIQSGGLEYSAVLLISALIFLYTFIAFNGFILDKKIGCSCVLMYIVFISFACMLELNVFFPVNLPPCL